MDETKQEVVNDEATKTESPSVENHQADKETKTFTQEELDKIVSERVGKTKASYLKKLGIEKDDDIQSLLDKASKNDELVKRIQDLELENTNYKKADLERGYKSTMKEVDEDFIDYVYQQVPPKDNESKEDYAVRLNEYLEQHPKVKKTASQVVGTTKTNLDLNGEQKKVDIALRQAMGLK
jgi:hypothetical protein